MKRAILIVTIWLSMQSGLAALDVPIAGGGRIHASVQSVRERRWEHVLRQGMDISCGTAALATILHFEYQDLVSEQQLITTILGFVDPNEVRRRGGFSLLDLKRVALARGYEVNGYKLTVSQLAEMGRSAVVPVTIRNFKHFAVFRGVVNDRVILADPAFGNITIPQGHFERLWKGVALVITPGKRAAIQSALRIAPKDAVMAESPHAKQFFRGAIVHAAIGRNDF